MMKNKMISAVALSLCLGSCQSGKIVDEKTGRATNARKDGPSGYYYDDMARYLGGFDIPADSKLMPYTQSPEYAEHRQKMAIFWEKVRSHNIIPVSGWRESTLYRNPNGVVCREDRPAIYPLSGADVINLYTLCPQASEYIMIAMERAGDIPHPEKQTAQYYRGLAATRSVINNIADKNYFKSAHMRRNIIHNEEIPGIAPVLLAFASGIDWRIVDMEKIYLSPDGTPVALDDPNLEFKPRGVRIWFRVEGDKRLRSLVYIEQFLDAESMGPNHPLAKFLKQKAGGFMMLKAAIYLMHNPYYRSVRDFFMTIPDVIVQDDSGFRYVDLRENWEIAVYGYFSGPLPIRGIRPAKPIQPELTSLYKERKPPDLPFHFGYGSLRRPPRSNLMVAHRRNA